jgi:hypothetical protein
VQLVLCAEVEFERVHECDERLCVSASALEGEGRIWIGI